MHNGWSYHLYSAALWCSHHILFHQYYATVWGYRDLKTSQYATLVIILSREILLPKSTSFKPLDLLLWLAHLEKVILTSASSEKLTDLKDSDTDKNSKGRFQTHSTLALFRSRRFLMQLLHFRHPRTVHSKCHAWASCPLIGQKIFLSRFHCVYVVNILRSLDKHTSLCILMGCTWGRNAQVHTSYDTLFAISTYLLCWVSSSREGHMCHANTIVS